MRAVALLLLIPVALWVTQTALLRLAGLPLRWRIHAPDLPRSLKRWSRLATNLIFLATLLACPAVAGQSLLGYYGRFLPLGDRPLEAVYGLCAAGLYLSLLYLAWTLSDNVRFARRHPWPKLLRRLAAVPFTAVLVAAVEELLFRAVLLAGLLEALPVWLAVGGGAAVFAGAHYIRHVKRYWTFPGHLALGLLFCVPFVCTGALWLSIGLHAGGVMILMVTRPLIRYTGPAWLVGASIFPYAGMPGIAALLLLTLNIWLAYGAAQ